MGASEVGVDPQTVMNYLQLLVVPELSEEKIDNLPYVKAACIKFIFMFRNQIAVENLPVFSLT